MSLFKNFWGSIDPHSEAVEQVVKPKVTAPRFAVKDIHEDFNTEVDRLLEFANIRKSINEDENLREKWLLLKNLGFEQCKIAEEGRKQSKEALHVRQFNNEKQELADAINYFSFKYPNYKFITKESIHKICEKYGLVYSSVRNYIGDIPDKNIEHLAKFRIDEEDCLWGYDISTEIIDTYEHRRTVMNVTSIESNKTAVWTHFNRNELDNRWSTRTYERKSPPTKRGLCIAANKKDFDMSQVTQVGYKLQDIPDPVVFQPVVYKEKPYYLIITAWGDEASDELVVNHKMN